MKKKEIGLTNKRLKMGRVLIIKKLKKKVIDK